MKLGVLQGGPGSTVLDLHDSRLGVTCPFGEEGHYFVITERVKGSLEQDHPVLALALDSDATRTGENVICNWVGEQAGFAPIVQYALVGDRGSCAANQQDIV